MSSIQNSDGDISVDPVVVPVAEPEDSDSDTLGMKVNAAYLRLTRVDDKDPAQVLTYGGNEEESVAPLKKERYRVHEEIYRLIRALEVHNLNRARARRSAQGLPHDGSLRNWRRKLCSNVRMRIFDTMRSMEEQKGDRNE